MSADSRTQAQAGEPERTGEPQRQIPTAMLEALSRNFCREAMGYGFKQVDFIRFINLLLDAAMNPAPVNGNGGEAPDERLWPAEPSARRACALPLSDDNVTVRAFERAVDLSLLEQWVEETNGRYFLLSCSTSVRSSIHEIVDSAHNLLGVITLRDGTPVGAVAFLDMDPVQRKAELRKLIGVPSMRGKGLAKEASRLWIRYGLETLGLNKIYLNTTHTNLRNVKLNEELGFKVEGILRNELLVDGEYHDVLRMGLWRSG